MLRQVLELGESDFSTLLNSFEGAMNANYIRVYWSQMLEAVDAIHQRTADAGCVCGAV